MSTEGNQHKVGNHVHSLSILVCDEDQEYQSLIKAMLSKDDRLKFKVRCASSNGEIEKKLTTSDPDVIVLALNLKEKSVFEWLSDIEQRDIAPVVIIAEGGNEMIAVEAMKNGAYDYLSKTYMTPDQLKRSLVNTREKWLLEKEAERLQEVLAHMAMYDGLTDILSRHALMSQIEVETNRSKRYKRSLSVLMIDIDFFKKVNDTYGHIIGDKVIKALADTLKLTTRGSDFVGRYGGEEFLVVLPETSIDKALVLANKLLKAVRAISVLTDDGDEVKITISIGAAGLKNDKNVEKFIGRADSWLYKAKDNGRDQVQSELAAKSA